MAFVASLKDGLDVIHDFGAALSAQCAQDEAEVLALGGQVDGALADGSHFVVVVVFFRDALVVGVVPVKKNRKCSCVIIDREPATSKVKTFANM